MNALQNILPERSKNKSNYFSKAIKKAKQKVFGMPVSINYNKPDAAKFILERAGIDGVNYWGAEVEGALAKAIKLLPAETNTWLQKMEEPETGPFAMKAVFEGNVGRSLGRPKYLNGRPPYYPDVAGEWPSHQGPLKYVEIDGGYLGALPDILMAFTPDRMMLDYVGSKYRGLINYYDVDLQACLDSAIYYDCTALVIADDIWDMNYCHWLCDWLPRLIICKKAFPGQQVKIITNKLVSNAQRDSLRLLGYQEDDIIPFDRMHVGRFKKLVVPNDLGQINHPAHRGAEWALDFLKEILDNKDQDQSEIEYPENIYLSRADAPGRKLVNENEFVSEISKLGFKTIVLSDYSFLRQAKLLHNAKNVVGIHGAGLTNIVFGRPDAKLLEVTPISYGMPSFFILCGAQGIDYATYVTQAEPGTITPYDNLIVDVDDLISKVRDFFDL